MLASIRAVWKYSDGERNWSDAWEWTWRSLNTPIGRSHRHASPSTWEILSSRSHWSREWTHFFPRSSRPTVNFNELSFTQSAMIFSPWMYRAWPSFRDSHSSDSSWTSVSFESWMWWTVSWWTENSTEEKSLILVETASLYRVGIAG